MKEKEYLIKYKLTSFCFNFMKETEHCKIIIAKDGKDAIDIFNRTNLDDSIFYYTITDIKQL